MNNPVSDICFNERDSQQIMNASVKKKDLRIYRREVGEKKGEKHGRVRRVHSVYT
jgi:hypothetical protein